MTNKIIKHKKNNKPQTTQKYNQLLIIYNAYSKLNKQNINNWKKEFKPSKINKPNKKPTKTK